MHRRIVPLGVMAAALAALAPAQAQTWTRVIRNAPGAVNMVILLSDGTVMAGQNAGGAAIGNAWYKLKPDRTGSYVNGTWATLTPAGYTRLYHASQVLRDGRVFVAGGEYGTGNANAQVYDPVANTWTNAPIPTSLLNPNATSPATGNFQQFSDACSALLPNGNVLICPVHPRTNGQTLLYNPTTNTWSAGPNLVRGLYQAEATWVKLPDESILTIDPFGTLTERYIPALNAWVNDAVVPTTLYDTFVNELGPALMLHTGRAIYFGSTGRTALYTPSGTTAPGTWVQGPTFPNARGMPDAPASMLVTGNILCAVGIAPVNNNPFVPPTSFYEYVTATNSFVSVPAPTGPTDNVAVYTTMLLNLPDGSSLYTHFGADLWVYRPSGTPLDIRPVIQSASVNEDGSIHLTGTRFNGWCEGSIYGDEGQNSSNFPLVRLLADNGDVSYGRAFNWSSTGVQTGDAEVSTEYSVPASVPAGRYTAVVVANGIASDPLCPTPPSITSAPGTRAVCATGVSQFDIAAGGEGGTPSYVWQFSGGVAGATEWKNLAEGTNTAGTFMFNAVGSRTEAMSVDPGTGSWVPAAASGYVPFKFRCVVVNSCGVAVSTAATMMVAPADLGNQSGLIGSDGVYDNNDFIVFINQFFGSNPRADIGSQGGLLGSDGAWDNNDLVVFVNLFFQGC